MACSLKPLEILRIPPEHMLDFDYDHQQHHHGLPNDVFPSDHVRVEAVLQLPK